MTDLYGSMFRKVLFPAYESGLRRRKTLQYLREYEQSQWLPPEEVEALQWQKLQRLIRHCWEQVPYYRERWQPLGITGPGDIASPADYARLPMLQKPEIRANFDKLIALDQRDGLLYKTTGGSTGEPLRFGYTRDSYQRRLAVMWRGYGWSGAQLGQRTLYLWSIPLSRERGAQPPVNPGSVSLWDSMLGGQKRKDRLYHAAFNRLMLNSFEMTEARMSTYADAIDRFRPLTIVAYVSSLVRLAEWLLATGRRIHSPCRILGAAESLHEHQRKILEEAFGCPAYNTYGCREFMLIAAECEHRNGLHVNADHLNVELGAPAENGNADGPRDIVITDLHNYGMPLMRYGNGDMATRGDGTCACGRGLPLLASVDGRKLDLIRTKTGHVLPGEFFPHMFKDIAGVRFFQVIQRNLDSIQIRIVANDNFTTDEESHVRMEVSKVLGNDTAIEICLVEKIDPTKGGKSRVTISEL